MSQVLARSLAEVNGMPCFVQASIVSLPRLLLNDPGRSLCSAAEHSLDAVRSRRLEQVGVAKRGGGWDGA
jgi:hypothetical protein